MSKMVLVLGGNGRFGRMAVRAFADAGWNVLAQTRRPLLASGQVRPLAIPVTDRAAIAAVARGAAVVVNALNPLYTRWDAEALPLGAAAIEIARALDATLMLPGNVYNFGSPMPAVLAEDAPERPTNRKGEIRCRMEADMRRGAPRSIVVRAGDFFGGPGTGSWMDQAILRDLARGRVSYPGPLHVAHAWAYLPDLAQAFVRLAELRATLGAHEAFHFPGHTLTGEEMLREVNAAAHRAGIVPPDRDLKVKAFPWPLLRVAGLFNPMMRELVRMSYLWREPHRLAGEKLGAAIGHAPQTPLAVALDRTLLELKFSRVQAEGASLTDAA